MKTRRFLNPTTARMGGLLTAVALLCCAALFSSTSVTANHPVLVEGNCESPVPGTTLVAPGTCGDFDGDGRVGTAEDTDGADRIFGTLNAAIGPGTGAAAGTGANHNGTVLIVTSGRFAEQVYIGQNLGGPGQPGVNNPGNVTLEAAPGVMADIDAVLQGDPAGGNATRQNGIGINVVYTINGFQRLVTLRNLTVRNFSTGILANQAARVNIDRCRVENNLNYGILLFGDARATVTNTHVTGTGFRIGGPSAVANPGDGMIVDGQARAKVQDSTFTYSARAGISNFNPLGAAALTLYKVSTYFNQQDTIGPNTIAPNPNYAQ